MIIREINLSDEKQLDSLIEEVESNLENRLFWLPISDTSRSHFFDATWTHFVGAFDHDTLVAAVGLFFNENEYGENIEALHLTNDKCAEIGRAMVKVDYRHQGLMQILTEKLMEYAKECGVEKLVATVHPDNIPSQRTFFKLGFEKQGYIVKKNDYERDIFLKCI